MKDFIGPLRPNENKFIYLGVPSANDLENVEALINDQIHRHALLTSFFRA